jgi:hypothetical protein
MKTAKPQGIQQAASFSLRYDQTIIVRTAQFVISAGEEEVLIECSSGLIPDESGADILPIHTRLALPWSAARRLANLLSQVVKVEDHRHEHETTSDDAMSPEPLRGRAKLPKLEPTNA